MRYTAIFLLALVCCHSVSAVSLRKSAETSKTSIAIERLRFVGKKSPLASQIVAAVELHLSSGGKVDDVIALVEEAAEDVRTRRAALNTEFLTKKSDLEKIISDTNQSLVGERADLEDAHLQIKNLNDHLESLAAQIESLESELTFLDTREKLVNDARDNDTKTYAVRKVRDENSLSALETIIAKLQALQARGNSFLQVSKKEIERALSRIPKSNPIQALVQLSSQFSEEKLASVIVKLQQIQTAIQQSYAEDRAGEENSLNHYNLLIAEITSVRAQKQKDLAQAQADQAQAHVDLTAQETRRDGLLTQIDLNEHLVASTQHELDEAILNYNHRIAEADDAIAAIDSALRILNQNKDDLAARETRSDVLNA